jgi:hypothetical protein
MAAASSEETVLAISNPHRSHTAVRRTWMAEVRTLRISCVVETRQRGQ